VGSGFGLRLCDVGDGDDDGDGGAVAHVSLRSDSFIVDDG
jgi:hypothetical protein